MHCRTTCGATLLLRAAHSDYVPAVTRGGADIRAGDRTHAGIKLNPASRVIVNRQTKNVCGFESRFEAS